MPYIRVRVPGFGEKGNTWRQKRRFMAELAAREGEFWPDPEEDRCPAWVMLQQGYYHFDSKCEADEFIAWLMTFDSWTETYAPVRVKYVK